MVFFLRIEGNPLQFFVEVCVNGDMIRIIEGLDTAITTAKATTLNRVNCPQVAANSFFRSHWAPSKDSVITILDIYFFSRRNR